MTTPLVSDFRPGTTFYDCCRRKCHYVGFVYDEGCRLHIYWRWNRFSRSRVYCVEEEVIFYITISFAKIIKIAK